MKNSLICITAFILLVCCTKQNKDLTKVESFIENLKADENDRIAPIDFNVDDIDELLKYTNEHQRITNFPRNPLSSFYVEEVTLGMYILWTIESIRMEEIEDPDFYLFASLNPRIAEVNSAELVDQDLILPDVAKAYADWWTSSLVVEEKLKINPLDDLGLRWN